jgi:stearoyl-CoA desaturase (Delta-9 desaturase)
MTSSTGENELYRMGAAPESASRRFALLTFLIVPALGVGLAVALCFAWGAPPLWCWTLLFFSWLWTGLGGTVGYHRLLSHRSFEAPAGVRAFWIAAAIIGAQGSPLVWCGFHRIHHAHTDEAGDPHSPWTLNRTGRLRDLWFSHCGWLLDLKWDGPELERMVPDLRKDPVVCFFERTNSVWPLLGLVLPTLFGFAMTQSARGALLGLLWGGLLRLFLTQHLSWAVNSICHRFGRITYQTGDASKNNALFGVLALGEGWHNNHHAFPASARHGFGLQFDISWCVIRAMELLRLVRKVHLPERELMERRRITSKAERLPT